MQHFHPPTRSTLKLCLSEIHTFDFYLHWNMHLIVQALNTLLWLCVLRPDSLATYVRWKRIIVTPRSLSCPTCGPDREYDPVISLWVFMDTHRDPGGEPKWHPSPASVPKSHPTKPSLSCLQTNPRKIFPVQHDGNSKRL